MSEKKCTCDTKYGTKEQDINFDDSKAVQWVDTILKQTCDGCKLINFSRITSPCCYCKRNPHLKDHFEKETVLVKKEVDIYLNVDGENEITELSMLRSTADYHNSMDGTKIIEAKLIFEVEE